MKPMPWTHRYCPVLLSDPDVHVAQLVAANQPGTLRSAIYTTRRSAQYLIRGARMVQQMQPYAWRETLEVLRGYRHTVRVCVRALRELEDKAA